MAGSVVGVGRGFWRFWTSTGLSNVADGLVEVALPLVALHLTRSPLLISGIAVATGLPWLLFALLAGVLADRVDRRRLLIVVDTARALALASAAVLLLAGAPSLWAVYALAFALGTAESMYDTAAQSVLPMIVPSEGLERANSRLQGAEIVGNYFVGPPLGGVLVGVSAALALATGSAVYLLAVLALVAVRGRFRVGRVDRAAGAASLRADLAAGLAHVWRHPVLRRMALLVAAMMLAYAATVAVLPVFAVTPGPMRLTAAGFGVFTAATAVGGILAALTGERVTARLGAGRSLRLAVLGMAVSLASPLLRHPVVVAAVWTTGAYFIVVWNIVTVSARQRLVPEQLLGRANSVYRMASWGSVPVGAALGGALASAVSPRATFACCGLGVALLVAATRPLTDGALLAPAVPEGAQAGARIAR